MDSLYYESNGGSGLYGFCVFLSFRLSVNILLWVLCDYCEMLVFIREEMGFLDCKYCALVIESVSLVCYDDSLWKMVTMVHRGGIPSPPLGTPLGKHSTHMAQTKH
jgi:hypothetical protein